MLPTLSFVRDYFWIEKKNSGAGEIALLKVFCHQAWLQVLICWSLHSRKRRMTLICCSLASTYMVWYIWVCAHHTHTCAHTHYHHKEYIKTNTIQQKSSSLFSLLISLYFKLFLPSFPFNFFHFPLHHFPTSSSEAHEDASHHSRSPSLLPNILTQIKLLCYK